MSDSDLETDGDLFIAPVLPPRDYPRNLKHEHDFRFEDLENAEPPPIPERSYKTHSNREPPLIPERSYKTVLKGSACPPVPTRSNINGGLSKGEREKVISPTENKTLPADQDDACQNVIDGLQKLDLQNRGSGSRVSGAQQGDKVDGLARPPQQLHRYNPYQKHTPTPPWHRPTHIQADYCEENQRDIINGCIQLLDTSITEDFVNVPNIFQPVSNFVPEPPLVPPKCRNISNQQIGLNALFHANNKNDPSPPDFLGSYPAPRLPFSRNGHVILHPSKLSLTPVTKAHSPFYPDQNPPVHASQMPQSNQLKHRPPVQTSLANSCPQTFIPKNAGTSIQNGTSYPNIFPPACSVRNSPPNQVTTITANGSCLDQFHVNNKQKVQDLPFKSSHHISEQILNDGALIPGIPQSHGPISNPVPCVTRSFNAETMTPQQNNISNSYPSSSPSHFKHFGQNGVLETGSFSRGIPSTVEDKMLPSPCMSNSSEDSYIHCIVPNNIPSVSISTDDSSSMSSFLSNYSLRQQSPSSQRSCTPGSPLDQYAAVQALSPSHQKYNGAQQSPISPCNSSNQHSPIANNIVQGVPPNPRILMPDNALSPQIPGDIFDLSDIWDESAERKQNNLSISPHQESLNSNKAGHNVALNITGHTVKEPSDINVTCPITMNNNRNSMVIDKEMPKIINVDENDNEEMSFEEAIGLIPCYHGECILHTLAAMKNYKLLDKAIQWLGSNKDYFLNIKNRLSQTPLFIAVQQNDVLMARKLIAYGADVRIQGQIYENGELRTPLHIAAGLGERSLGMLDLFLSCDNIDIDVLSVTDHITPLHVAIGSHKEGVINCFPTVQMLVDNGANVEIPNELSSKTPLIQIIEKQDLLLIKNFLQLLEKSCKDGSKRRRILNTATRSGDTCLHIAAGLSKLQGPEKVTLLRLLVRQGADSCVLNNAKEKPSDFAAQEWRDAFKNR